MKNLFNTSNIKSKTIKFLSLILTISIISTNSIIVNAKTLNTSFDISNASEELNSYDWSMSEQGYRVYLVDKNNQVVSKKLDIIYSYPSATSESVINKNKNVIYLSDSTKVSFKSIEKELGEPSGSIPFAVGFKVDANGQKSIQGYTQNGKSLIMDWLLGGNEKPYYLVSKTSTGADFTSISQAIASVPSCSTILIENTNEDYIETVNVSEPVALIGITKNGRKPILKNSDGNNIEMCHYEYCPLMIASGFVKDLDIIEVESQNEFYETVCTLDSKYNSKIAKKDANGNVLKDENGNILYYEATDSNGNILTDENGNTIYIRKHNPEVIGEDKEVAPTAYAVHVENYNSKDRYLEFNNCTLISNGNNALGMGTRKGLKFIMKDCSLIATDDGTGTPMFIHDSADVLDKDGNLRTDTLGEYNCTFENCIFESKKSDNTDIILRNFTEITINNQKIETNNKGKFNFINCKLVEPTETSAFKICLDAYKFNVTKSKLEKQVTVLWSRTLKLNTDENNTKWGLFNKRGLTLTKGEITESTLSEQFLSNNVFASLKGTEKISNKTLNPVDSEQGYERLNKLLNIKINRAYFFENIGSGAKTGTDNNGDGKLDNVTDMMEINNYRVVVEPIIWIQPANFKSGKYYNVSKNIVYGTFKEVVTYLDENSTLHDNDKTSNAYYLLQALSTVTN